MYIAIIYTDFKGETARGKSEGKEENKIPLADQPVQKRWRSTAA
jgi:hypothetical protein